MFVGDVSYISEIRSFKLSFPPVSVSSPVVNRVVLLTEACHTSLGKRAKAREEKRKTEYDDKMEEIKKVRKEVDAVLENFREEAR